MDQQQFFNPPLNRFNSQPTGSAAASAASLLQQQQQLANNLAQQQQRLKHSNAFLSPQQQLKASPGAARGGPGVPSAPLRPSPLLNQPPSVSSVPPWQRRGPRRLHQTGGAPQAPRPTRPTATFSALCRPVG